MLGVRGFSLPPEGYDDNFTVTTRADVWFLGIATIDLAQGITPLGEAHMMRVLFAIPRLESGVLTFDRPWKWSEDFLSFVAWCVQKNPLDRPSPAQLLRHSFLVRSHEDPEAAEELWHRVRMSGTFDPEDKEDGTDLSDPSSSSSSSSE